MPLTVYILEVVTPGENSMLIDVYATKDLAEKRAKEIKKENKKWRKNYESVLAGKISADQLLKAPSFYLKVSKRNPEFSGRLNIVECEVKEN